MNKQGIISRLQSSGIDTAAYDAKIILEDVVAEKKLHKSRRGLEGG